MKHRLLTLLLFIPVFAFPQVNFFVSPAGDNNNPGTLAAPWRTVQHGLDQLSTNDTLNLLTGTYAEKVVIPISGITLRNHAGHNPVLDGQGLTAQNSIIEIHDHSGITVQGLELQNSIMLDAQGIRIEGDCQNITIAGCAIHDIHFNADPTVYPDSSTHAQGIVVYGNASLSPMTNIQLLDNELYNCRLGYSKGITVDGNVDGFEISGNHIHDLANTAIACIGHKGTCSEPHNDQARNGVLRGNIVTECKATYATTAGVYIDGGRSLLLENNTIYYSAIGIEVACESVGKQTDGILIRNNLIHDNDITGVVLGGRDYPSGSGKVTNSSLINNSCLGNGYGTQIYGEIQLMYSEHSVIQNNIFYLVLTNILVNAELGQPGLFFDYNVVYNQFGGGNVAGNWNGTTYNSYTSFLSTSQVNANGRYADPAFVSIQFANTDLHLLPSSPAIGAANPNYLPQPSEVDMDGEPRAFGVLDCGVDEFHPGTGLPQPLSATGILVYPNPAADLLYLEHLPAQAHVTLHDATGASVYNGPVQPGKGISLRDFPAGTYLLTVTARNGQQSWSKVVKQ